jgi:hypothetical protein
VPSSFLIPPEFQVDVLTASDEEIFSKVVKLVGAYLFTLDYSKDKSGNYNGSPYDLFLRKNGLPLAPSVGESSLEYSQKLLKKLLKAKSVSFVSTEDGKFNLHEQDFVFGQAELHGMRVFFGKAQCVQCHSAPDFTDHLFHNTGVSQDEYDRIHGFGKFMNLPIPDLAERNSRSDLYLSPSEKFPQALGLLRSIPIKSDPRRADLGVWAVFANPAMPRSQALLRLQICQSVSLDCALYTDDEILKLSIGMIKTPTVRDLGHSQPYLHTGQSNQIEEVLRFYIRYSVQAHMGKVRNPDPRLKDIEFSVGDIEDLTLFLKALNEDYH